MCPTVAIRIALRNAGLTVAEAGEVRLETPGRGLHPSFGSIVVRDNAGHDRELHRVYCPVELAHELANPLFVASLIRQARHALA